MLSYVMPIRAQAPAEDLADYLAWLAQRVDVIVVDGSPRAVFAEHHRRWAAVRHVPVDDDLVTANGKVGGVLTGMRHAAHCKVVVADDDVRYTARNLDEVDAMLDQADVVRPQNYFVPAPWHARWDTARSLIARATGGDWPGTLCVNREVLASTGGYRGDVIFENFELFATMTTASGRFADAPGLFVPRRPPTVRHFWSQRTRQAYDEFARPQRLVIGLALLPIVLVGGPRAAAALGVASIALAEIGRRRHGGRAVFPPTAVLWAPAWVAERSITSWLAVVARARGGVRYGGARLPVAASRCPQTARRGL
jgi:hypothetical protein